MSLGETVLSVLEKLSSIKIAATAALASFILFITSILLLYFLEFDQIIQLESSSSFEKLRQVIFIFYSSKHSDIVAILPVLLIIFTVSCSSLLIDLLKKIKDSINTFDQWGRKLIKSLIKLHRMYVARGKKFSNIMLGLSKEHRNFLNLFSEKEIVLIEGASAKAKVAQDLFERYNLLEIIVTPANNQVSYRLSSEYEPYVVCFINGNSGISEYRKQENFEKSIIFFLEVALAFFPVLTILLKVFYYGFLAFIIGGFAYVIIILLMLRITAS